MPIIPLLRKLRQDDPKFKARLGYEAKLSLYINKQIVQVYL
jgi:hypothetical protein